MGRASSLSLSLSLLSPFPAGEMGKGVSFIFIFSPFCHTPARPAKKRLKAYAPGSGTCFHASPPATYTLRPSAGLMPTVAAAPSTAARAARCTSRVAVSVATKGSSASTTVRSPRAAGV